MIVWNRLLIIGLAGVAIAFAICVWIFIRAVLKKGIPSAACLFCVVAVGCLSALFILLSQGGGIDVVSKFSSGGGDDSSGKMSSGGDDDRSDVQADRLK